MLDLDEAAEAYCEEMIKWNEGFKAYPYKDTMGHWTIGYGTNIEAVHQLYSVLDDLKEHGITIPIAILWLRNDIHKASVDIRWTRQWTNQLERGQKIGLIDMCYNLGINKLLDFQKFLDALKIGDIEVAQKELANSLWAKQVGKRAERISALIATKGLEYVDLGFNQHGT
jgi:lysozyme